MQADLPPPGEAAAPPQRRGVPLWLPLAAALLAVVFALGVAAVACGPLLAIVNPPMPPLYPGVTLLDSRRVDYGVDEWTYRTDADPCEVVAFYLQHARSCTPLALGFCAAPREPGTDEATRFVAMCSGGGAVGPFSWRWRVSMRAVYSDDTPHTAFELSRTMYWGTGSGGD